MAVEVLLKYKPSGGAQNRLKFVGQVLRAGFFDKWAISKIMYVNIVNL